MGHRAKPANETAREEPVEARLESSVVLESGSTGSLAPLRATTFFTL